MSGAAGVIGRELVMKLVSRGHVVLAGDLKPRPEYFDSSVEYCQGDLNEVNIQVLESFKPEIFVHLAATFERSEESLDFWSENYDNNVRLSHHLLTICQNLPSMRKVLFASSYLVYDSAFYLGTDEERGPKRLSELDSIHPRNLIGSAKYFHELELEYLRRFSEVKFAICSVRIFRGYGCGSRDVISRWVQSLLLEEEISVYSQDGMFDYIFSKDSAEGLLRILEGVNPPSVVNLGTGSSRSIREVCAILRSHFPNAKMTERFSDVAIEKSEADTRLLRESVNWVPEYRIEDAISEIITYEQSEKREGEKR